MNADSVDERLIGVQYSAHRRRYSVQCLFCEKAFKSFNGDAVLDRLADHARTEHINNQPERRRIQRILRELQIHA